MRITAGSRSRVYDKTDAVATPSLEGVAGVSGRFGWSELGVRCLLSKYGYSVCEQ